MDPAAAPPAATRLACRRRPDVGVPEQRAGEQRPRRGRHALAGCVGGRAVRLHVRADLRRARVRPHAETVRRRRRGVDVVADPLLVDVVAWVRAPEVAVGPDVRWPSSPSVLQPRPVRSSSRRGTVGCLPCRPRAMDRGLPRRRRRPCRPAARSPARRTSAGRRGAGRRWERSTSRRRWWTTTPAPAHRSARRRRPRRRRSRSWLRCRWVRRWRYRRSASPKDRCARRRIHPSRSARRPDPGSSTGR